MGGHGKLKITPCTKQNAYLFWLMIDVNLCLSVRGLVKVSTVFVQRLPRVEETVASLQLVGIPVGQRGG